MNTLVPTIIVDPQDGTRRATHRKQHIVMLGDQVLYEAGDRAEAVTWLDGFLAGFGWAS